MDYHALYGPQFERALFEGLVLDDDCCYSDKMQLIPRLRSAYRFYVDEPPRVIQLRWSCKFSPYFLANSALGTYGRWRYDRRSKKIIACDWCHTGRDLIPESKRSLTVDEALSLCHSLQMFHYNVLDLWMALLENVYLDLTPQKPGSDCTELWMTRFNFIVLRRCYLLCLPTSIHGRLVANAFDTHPAMHEQLVWSNFLALASAYWDVVHTYRFPGTEIQFRGGECDCEDQMDFARHFEVVCGKNRNDFETCFRKMFLTHVLKLPVKDLCDKVDGVIDRKKEVVIRDLFLDLKEKFRSPWWWLHFPVKLADAWIALHPTKDRGDWEDASQVSSEDEYSSMASATSALGRLISPE